MPTQANTTSNGSISNKSKENHRNEICYKELKTIKYPEKHRGKISTSDESKIKIKTIQYLRC